MLTWLIDKFICEPAERNLLNGKTLKEVYGYKRLWTMEELHAHRLKILKKQYEEYKSQLEKHNQ